MDYKKMDGEILNRIKLLNGEQKTDVLDYVVNMPKTSHNSRLYRRKALKQIREALANS